MKKQIMIIIIIKHQMGLKFLRYIQGRSFITNVYSLVLYIVVLLFISVLLSTCFLVQEFYK